MKLGLIATIMLGIYMSPINANVFIARQDVIQFIDEISTQHQLDRDKISQAFSKIEPSQEVIQRMMQQYEALPWHKYRALFLTDKKIKCGVDFWKSHAELLQKAETQYGVPAQFIVAIIGIESTYGKSCGKYPVFQTLATLAFDYQPRAAFFKNELKEYILLVEEQRLDPLSLKGSYAGAIGIPQFIASSYRKFAVDFDNTGQIDLLNSMPQVIGSIANYFKEHGWQTSKPVVSKAITKGHKHKKLPISARNDPRPEIPLTIIHEHDVMPAISLLDPNTHVAWLEFDLGKDKEYWLGLNNFYVITRYNHSANYALAVHELADAIAKAYKH